MTAMTSPSWAQVGGPLAPYAGGFRVELERLGYTPLTAATHVRLMAHLSRWLAREGVDASGLTPAVVDAYFAERRAAGYAGHITGRALRPLAGYLRRLGVIPPPAPAVAASAEERLLARYREYLLLERGLAGTTADLNVRMVRPFLAGRVQETDAGVDLGQLTAREVAAFVVTQSRQRPKPVKRMVTALRSLLGFLRLEGLIGQPLAVPSPAGWIQAGLPRALDGDQVAALLACCDPRTRTGRRDLAILTLLARLGLRAGEVAALRLDDIDWRRGEITVRGKGNRHDRLPLPADAGQRIVAYLQDGRPGTAQGRTVFVRAQAPYRALTSNAVTTVVACAGQRAGLGVIGAHRLRHSAATAMLRSGGSLTEIGQTLRHARPLTTAIYAKVDVAALRQLARPWPGEPA
jgi:site-specific recombinase XerD